MDEVVLEDVLIAVVHQHVRGRVLKADADHRLGVLASFAHEWRKIRIPADDHECIDVLFSLVEVEGVNDHADGGRVLAGVPRMGISISSKAAACVAGLNSL